MVIDARYFLSRIGHEDEKPMDRKFWSALALWNWRAKWREAERKNNYSELDRLDREYEMIVGI